MKITKIDTHKLLSAFSKLGVRYYSFGTLSKRGGNGRKVNTHDYYESDSITDGQKESLKALFPSIEFFISQSQYAPEIKRGLIASPKAARLRELNA
tara:strand:- start:300 stop:587 length:288 start_codon:yes stop_codon:yes gene_type:complete